MASTISLTSSNVQVLRTKDFQSYTGLRTGMVQRSFGTMPATKVQPVKVIRASREQETLVKSSGFSNEECEANAVAGNFPEPPPLYRPASPKGTADVKPLQIIRRPRHNRKSPALRASFLETNIAPSNLVLPLFIHEGEEDTPIGAMPGCFRLGWRHGLLDEVYRARDVGINSDAGRCKEKHETMQRCPA